MSYYKSVFSLPLFCVFVTVRNRSPLILKEQKVLNILSHWTKVLFPSQNWKLLQLLTHIRSEVGRSTIHWFKKKKILAYILLETGLAGIYCHRVTSHYYYSDIKAAGRSTGYSTTLLCIRVTNFPLLSMNSQNFKSNLDKKKVFLKIVCLHYLKSWRNLWKKNTFCTLIFRKTQECPKINISW
jgi:hypothetical protein